MYLLVDRLTQYQGLVVAGRKARSRDILLDLVFRCELSRA
jgi:hypothetical protein